MLGAFSDAFAALDAQGVIYYREAIGILRYRTHGACLDKRTDMIMWAYIFVYLYHNTILYYFFAKLMQYFRSAKQDAARIKAKNAKVLSDTPC